MSANDVFDRFLQAGVCYCGVTVGLFCYSGVNDIDIFDFFNNITYNGTIEKWKMKGVSDMPAEQTIGTFGLFAIVGLLVFTLVLLPLYVLGSLGLMNIARKHGHAHDWAAWIPFYNSYLLGKIAYNKQVGFVLALVGFLSFSDWVIGFLPAPFSYIPLICLVGLTFVSLHRTYKRMSEKALLMTISTLFSCGLLFPIFLFVISRNALLSDCPLLEQELPDEAGDVTEEREQL